MGDLRLRYYDDMDDYSYLCRKYNQTKEHEVYSNHHRWLKMFDMGNTTQPYEIYNLEKRIEEIERVLGIKLKEVNKLQVELFHLKNEYNFKDIEFLSNVLDSDSTINGESK